jgi:hypothetical protein
MEDKIKQINDLMLLVDPTFEECMELDRLIDECTILEEDCSESEL